MGQVSIRVDGVGNPRVGVIMGSDSDLLVMPQVTARLYYRAVDLYGDPVAGIPVHDQSDFEAARANLRKAGC